ncbi:MAG: CHAD domain-containing protein [Bacteroidetes bacterium]|nr:CHAD domain-containing protein [Bacteroidota bacterium]
MVNHLTSNYFTSQRQAFEKNLPLIDDIHSQDAIHDIRVSLKKIRTLFMLFEFIAPEKFNSKIYFRSLRRLFRQVSVIRDLQVQQNLIKEMADISDGDCAGFIDFLADLETRERKKLEQWLTGFVLPDMNAYQAAVDTFSEEMDEGLFNEKLTAFINEKLMIIKSKSTGIPDDETLHDIRRLLKEARFMIDLKCAGNTDKLQVPELHKAIKAAEEILGKWHDMTIGAIFMRDYIADHSTQDQSPPEYCNNFLSYHLEEKERLEKVSIAAINGIISDFK